MSMQRQILIIDDHDDLATALDEVFSHIGHNVKVLEERSEAIAMENLEAFDLVITDLDVADNVAAPSLNGNGTACLPDISSAQPGEHIKAFKLYAGNFRRDEFDEDELRDMVATVLDYKIRFVDKEDVVAEMH